MPLQLLSFSNQRSLLTVFLINGNKAPYQESQRAQLARNAVELQHMIKRGINAQSNQEILNKIIHILGDELKAIKNNPSSSAYKLKSAIKIEQLSDLAYQPNLQAQDIEQIKLLQKKL